MQPAEPIMDDPIWRGRLTVAYQERDSSHRLVAHLSSLALPRAIEEARLFPEPLSSQLTSRPLVWPRVFLENGPNDEHIGLYFFPEAPADREAFNGLIGEMIRQDLALRVVVRNAELLIFASTQLPLPFWRFQRNLYLWGVFWNREGEQNSDCESDVID